MSASTGVHGDEAVALVGTPTICHGWYVVTRWIVFSCPVELKSRGTGAELAVASLDAIGSYV